MLRISSLLTHANIFDTKKKVKRWQDFWCLQFQDVEKEILRPFRLSRKVEPFKEKMRLQSGDVVALIPLPIYAKHSRMSEVWEIVTINEKEGKLFGRRMLRRREVDVLDGVEQGELNEFVRCHEEEEIKQFWERMEHEPRQLYMEYLQQEPGTDERAKWPAHLRRHLAGAGAVVSTGTLYGETNGSSI